MSDLPPEEPREGPKRDLRDPRYWLSRLVFPLIIVAGVLGYNAYKGWTGQMVMEGWKIVVDIVVAAICLVLAMAGMRIRHGGDEGMKR